MYLLHASAMVKDCLDCIFNGMGYEYNGIHHKGVFNSVHYVSIKVVLFLVFFSRFINEYRELLDTHICINYCFDYLPSVLTDYFTTIIIITYISKHSIVLHLAQCRAIYIHFFMNKPIKLPDKRSINVSNIACRMVLKKMFMICLSKLILWFIVRTAAHSFDPEICEMLDIVILQCKCCLNYVVHFENCV